LLKGGSTHASQWPSSTVTKHGGLASQDHGEAFSQANASQGALEVAAKMDEVKMVLAAVGELLL
jgi:hypothetical protein